MLSISGGIDSTLLLLTFKSHWTLGHCIVINHYARHETLTEYRLLQWHGMNNTLLKTWGSNSQTKLSNQRRLLLLYLCLKIGIHIVNSAHYYYDNIEILIERIPSKITYYISAISYASNTIMLLILKNNVFMLNDIHAKTIICYDDLTNKNAGYLKQNWRQTKLLISIWSAMTCLRCVSRNI